MSRLLMMSGLALVLIGCGEAVRLTDKRYPPKPKGAPIEIIYGETPTRSYERLGIVKESSGFSIVGDVLVEALKRQAREVGADALLLLHVGTKRVPPTFGLMGIAEGVAIRWVEPVVVGPPAAAVIPTPALSPSVPTPRAPPVAPEPIAMSTIPRWQLAVNAVPAGALVMAFDERQQLQQVGTTPCALLWPPRTAADALVVRYQGREVMVLPRRDEGVFVDFSAAIPQVEGGEVIRR